MPGLRRYRTDQSGRTVPAGCGCALPGVRRFPLWQRGMGHLLCEQTGETLFSAADDGDGCNGGIALGAVCTRWWRTKQRKVVHQRLEVLKNLGLGYLTLGEETPSLSGGEAQRLKLASEMGRGQSDSVFVFDEPTIGLHPLDVQTLLQVFQALIDNGATVLVIEHDLDVIRNADYIIDMGPGGGEDGGRVVAVGTPEQIRANADSITGKYL